MFSLFNLFVVFFISVVIPASSNDSSGRFFAKVLDDEFTVADCTEAATLVKGLEVTHRNHGDGYFVFKVTDSRMTKSVLKAVKMLRCVYKISKVN